MDDRAYSFNEAEFAYETFEDEVIVLNLLSGTYYTLTGSAIDLWHQLIHGRGLAKIIKAMAASYTISEDAIAAELSPFIATLVEEDILRQADEVDGNVTLEAPAYVPPHLEKHGDIQDLLTLDPIHDIDASRGWPHSAP